jgi:hypothetical protein
VEIDVIVPTGRAAPPQASAQSRSSRWPDTSTFIRVTDHQGPWGREVTMRVRRWLALGAVALVSVGMMTAAGARPQSAASAGTTQPTTVARSWTQQSCFQSGSGATFYRPCVSTHGNVMSLQAPSGTEHIYVGTPIEGYGICSDSGYLYDAGFNEAGFGAQTINQPNGANTFPLSIVRSGGGWRLTQTFARDAVQREFNITMALKNTGASPKTNVTIARFADIDADGITEPNYFDSSADAVWGRYTRNVALQAVSLATTHFVAIETFDELASLGLASGSCNIPNNAGPVTGDFAGVAYYTFGSIAAGVTKTVKFTYRIM